MAGNLCKMSIRIFLIVLGVITPSLFPLVPSLQAEVLENGEANPEEEEADIIEELKLFSKALAVIQEAYPEDVNQRQLLYKAVDGMLKSLDKFSEFIEPERYELLQIHMRGEYAGIGATLQLIDNFPAIKDLRPDSAAIKAGLLPEDKIIKINGDTTLGFSLVDAAKLLRGEEETALVLTIQRDRTHETFDVKIVREIVEIESVKDARLVGKSIGYFWIESWQDKTAEQVDKAIESLKKQGMRALIIDLRQNDGGLLPQAVALSERFLEKDKKIVSVDSKIEEQRKEYISTGKNHIGNYPLVILVNQISASASEIFTACMQDHHRGTVIGHQTYGKASVQSVVPLDEKSAMKLTTARYLSPLGRDINHIGLVPDEVVENGPAGGPNTDRQILKALEILREYM